MERLPRHSKILVLSALLLAALFGNLSAADYRWNPPAPVVSIKLSEIEWNEVTVNTGTKAITETGAVAKPLPSTGAGRVIITTTSSVTIDVDMDLDCGSFIFYNLDSGYAPLPNASTTSSITLTGSGNITCGTFDNPETGQYTLNIGSGITFEITNTLYANMTEATDFLKFTGDGNLIIPASGANCNWGSPKIKYETTKPRQASANPGPYSVTVTGLNGFPAGNIGITVSRTGSGTEPVKFPYTFEQVGSEAIVLDGPAASDDKTLTATSLASGITLSNTGAYSISSAAIAQDNGFEFAIYAPDGSGLKLKTIAYYNGVVRWLGAVDSTWTKEENWFIPAAEEPFDPEIYFSNKTFTVYETDHNPEISSAVKIKDVKIKANTALSVLSGGLLQVDTIDCEELGEFNGKNGTVEFVSAASSWNEDTSRKSSFGKVLVAPAANFSPQTDITVQKEISGAGILNIPSGKKITLDSDATLTGQSAGYPLRISGGGVISIGASQTLGKWLSIDRDAVSVVDAGGNPDSVFLCAEDSAFASGVLHGSHNGWIVLNPAMEFVWQGGTSSDWAEPLNWNYGLVPGMENALAATGSGPKACGVDTRPFDVTVPAAISGVWPDVLSTNYTVNGALKILGTLEYSAAGRLNKNDVLNNGTVRYKAGATTLTSFAESTGVADYANLKIEGSLLVAAGKDITASGTLSLSADASVTGSEGKSLVLNGIDCDSHTLTLANMSLTHSGAATQTGAISFEESAAATQTFTGNPSATYNSIIVNKSHGGSLAVKHEARLDSLSVTQCGNLTFEKMVWVASSYTDGAGGGNILFPSGCAFSPATTFLTTGIVTLGNEETDTCTFTSGMTHTAGTTHLAGNILSSTGNLDFGRAVLQKNTVINSGTGSANFTGPLSDSGQNDLTIKSDAEFSGGAVIGGDLIFDGNAKTFTISVAEVSSRNAILLHGLLNANAGLRTQSDLILLGPSYSVDDTGSDSPSGVSGLFSYDNGSRKCPANYASLLGNSFSGEVSVGAGNSLTVGKNFYANGISIAGSAAWNLNVPNNDAQSSAFAEIYNSTITNCHANFPVMAAEGNTVTGCVNVDERRPRIKEAWTVYDDVIFVSFCDSNGAEKKIENSENEISSAISKIQFFDGEGEASFAGTFLDADCSTTTDGAGDISSFYIKAPVAWNTDATGLSPGDASGQSENRSGTHSQAIPRVSVAKALAGVYETLRDSSKNRIFNYSGGDVFTQVEDKCAPVLTAVFTGQELHSENPLAQTEYDSHNFIEFHYSEPVEIRGTSTVVLPDAVNVQAGQDLGDVTNAALGISFLGLASVESGKAEAYLKEGSASPHALYRKYSDGVSSGAVDHAMAVRVSIAGYVDKTLSGGNKNWPGYIESAVSPSGICRALPNAQLVDSSGNAIDAAGAENHPLLEVVVNARVDQGDPGLYGSWDAKPPVFAPYVLSGNPTFDWNLGDSENRVYEIVGTVDSSSDVYLSFIEFHLFDNAQTYSAQDKYTWQTQGGWVEGGAVIQEAPDSFGGSIPAGGLGGIRFCSLENAEGAFSYSYKLNGQVSEERPCASGGIRQNVKSSLFRSQNKSETVTKNDGLYIAIPLNAGDSRLPARTSFVVTYDPSKSFITDLAGNRLVQVDEGKSTKTLTSIDVTPPALTMSLAQVGGKNVDLIFTKPLAYDGVLLSAATENSVWEKIASQFEFVRNESDNIDTDSLSDLKVQGAKFVSSGNDFGAIQLFVNRPITLSDIEHTWIRVVQGTQVETDISGISSYPTLIEDVSKNYMTYHTCHALSDFALNAVKVLYAFSSRKTDGGQIVDQDFYGEGEYAVRDFSEDSGNFGTIAWEKGGYDITLQAFLAGGYDEEKNPIAVQEEETVSLFGGTKKAVQEFSKSDKFNLHTGSSWRVWLPTSLSSLASEPNKNLVPEIFSEQVEGQNKNLRNFVFKNELCSFAPGDEVQFLFKLYNPNGEVTINHDGDATTPRVPLYALWLPQPDSSGIPFVDLWSFRIKTAALQRGGVTILNNVIDVGKREKTTVRVDLGESGNLNVIVMTLDGNIVTYLQHGRASSGTHFYTWNGTNNGGSSVARGLYFVRVTGPGIDETRKVLCVKD